MPLIHYLYFRLQTMHITPLPQPNFRPIRFPFDKLQHILDSEHRTILFKPEQAMKTPLCVALIWVYSFIRGSNVAIALRSIGCRFTGIPGFTSKGVDSINSRVREFLGDIRNQLYDNGWVYDKVVRVLTLKVNFDADVEWGSDGSLRHRPLAHPSRISQIANEASNVHHTPGLLICFPLNKSGVEFFCRL